MNKNPEKWLNGCVFNYYFFGAANIFIIATSKIKRRILS
jgi:hypothetical protein